MPPPCWAATSTFSNTVMSVNGLGTWYVRPMPRRHRAPGGTLVTVLPVKMTWPLSGARSPEMRPNRLVLPAPFGPTIPTVSPGLTEKDRSSAMTTRPNRFVTWSRCSRGLDITHLLEGWQQVAGDRRLREQRVVDDLGLQLVLGALLPLDADRWGDDDARGRVLAGREVHRAGHRVGDHHV